MDYYTISKPCEASLTEKRSEFIAQIAPITSGDGALAWVESIRAKHHKARHHVWAYQVRENNYTRYSDDGEPQGTGGIPVLGVLQKAKLTDVCCVVTRYFGGILLGASGLTRAYAAATALALEAATIVQFCETIRCRLTMDYTLYGKLQNELSAFPVKEVSSDFGTQITLTLDVKKDAYPLLEAHVINCSCGKVKLEQLSVDFTIFSSSFA